AWPIGAQIVPPDEFKKISEFAKHVSAIGFNVIAVTSVSDSELELQLAKGGTIAVSRRINFDQTVQNLQSVVSLKQQELKGTFVDTVQRIDVRFNGKAFVKLRGE